MDSEHDTPCNGPEMSACYPELQADGWEYRGTGEKSRIAELKDLYTDLGFEVKVMPLRGDEIPEDCHDCSKGRGDPEHYRVLFTRHHGK